MAVLQIDIASEDGLAILNDVDVCRATSARGEHLELDAVAGLEDGAVGAEKNLVGAATGLQRNVAGAAVAVVVVGLDVKRLMPEPGLMRTTATPLLSVDDLLVPSTGKMDRERGAGGTCHQGRSVRTKTWFSSWEQARHPREPR